MAAPATLKAEDKLQIIELSSRYNKTLDRRDIDGWHHNDSPSQPKRTSNFNNGGENKYRISNRGV
jgi:hypothetical protein